MRAAVLPLLILLPGLSPAAAQQPAGAPPDGRWSVSPWVGDVALLGANAALGGLTAGIRQRLRGGSFSDGFTRGAAGGGLAYLGRRVAAARFDGAGLLGRQVSAAGVSVVRNASERRASLERLFFPLGPLHLYWDRGERGGWAARVDGHGLIALATAVWQPELEFDLARTLSAGAPVFDAPRRWVLTDGEPANGLVRTGVVVLSGRMRADPDAVFAHERVHVLQQDFIFHAWTAPVEAWALGKTRAGRALHRYVEPNVTPLLVAWFLSPLGELSREDDPTEIEADFLEWR